MNNWHVQKLSSLATTSSGGTPSRKNPLFYNGDIPWIKSGELDDNYIYDSEEKISEEALKNSSAKLFPPNTVLIAMYGATAGKTALLKIQASTNQAVCGILPNLSVFIPEYLRYNLIFQRQHLLNQRYGGAQPNISQTIIRNLDIPLPELKIQNKITYLLTLMQKATEQQDKIIETTKSLKKSLMQKLFTEGLNDEPLKETEIGSIPQSWESLELGNIIEKTQYGYTASAEKVGNAQFLRITDITDTGVNWNTVPYCKCSDEEISKYQLVDNDIVFARIGATTGKSFLIKSPPSKAIFASYLIRVRAKDKVLPSYLYYFFQSEQYWKQINSHKGTSLKGGVNGSILSKLLIPLTTLEEQEKISEFFANLDRKIQVAVIKKATLRDLFNTLLNQLMSGELIVDGIDFQYES